MGVNVGKQTDATAAIHQTDSAKGGQLTSGGHVPRGEVLIETCKNGF